jgi:type IV secretion system protein VirB4
MLALKPFRDIASGLADLLNWSHLVADGVVLCKDGSLLAGWFYRGPDIASSTDDERNWLTGRINAALARLGSGWATWVEAARLPAPGYPHRELSQFPDAVSRLVDEERRRQCLREGAHYESEYALIVQYTPPLRRQGRLADIIYDDDDTAGASPGGRILEQFSKALADLEDAVGNAVRLRRMRGFTVTDRHGRAHLRDELVNPPYLPPLRTPLILKSHRTFLRRPSGRSGTRRTSRPAAAAGVPAWLGCVGRA